ncbi:MAG: transporter [Frankiales bacterium]|nr:transporter [Frankiales bacterium]
MSQPTAPESRWGLFTQRSFRVYWTGGFLSNVGTWLQNVTASVLVLKLTDSPLMVGVLNFATFAPIFALSMFGGMLSDRYDRRRVVVWTQVFSLAVAVVITVLTATGHITAPVLIALATLLGCSYALAKPALASLLPALVRRDEIARATAVNTLQFNLGQVVGSALSALILAVSTPTAAFAVNSASFVAPIVAMYLLRKVSMPDHGSRRSMRGSGREGLRFALGTPVLLSLLVAVALANASVEALRTLAPEITKQSLHLSADSAGLLVTAYSLGATVGLVIFSWLSRRIRANRLLASAFALQAVGVAGVAVSQALPEAAVLAVPIGLGFAFNIPVLSAGLQVLSPEHMRGRVMSLFSMVHLGLRPAFSLTAGALASLVNVRIALGVFTLIPLAAISLTARAGAAIGQTTKPQSEPEPANP